MNCLDVAVDPECMYNDQTDFVGGDLPQVTFFVIMTRMTFMIMMCLCQECNWICVWFLSGFRRGRFRDGPEILERVHRRV